MKNIEETIREAFEAKEAEEIKTMIEDMEDDGWTVEEIEAEIAEEYPEDEYEDRFEDFRLSYYQDMEDEREAFKELLADMAEGR